MGSDQAFEMLKEIVQSQGHEMREGFREVNSRLDTLNREQSAFRESLSSLSAKVEHLECVKGARCGILGIRQPVGEWATGLLLTAVKVVIIGAIASGISLAIVAQAQAASGQKTVPAPTPAPKP